MCVLVCVRVHRHGHNIIYVCACACKHMSSTYACIVVHSSARLDTAFHPYRMVRSRAKGAPAHPRPEGWSRLGEALARAHVRAHRKAGQGRTGQGAQCGVQPILQE